MISDLGNINGRFELGELADKIMLVFNDETPKNGIYFTPSELSIIKTITGSEFLRTEKKYQILSKILPKVLVFMTMNFSIRPKSA